MELTKAKHITVRGVDVSIVRFPNGTWVAKWLGSDRRLVVISRHTEQAVLDQIEPLMDLRKRVFGAEY